MEFVNGQMVKWDFLNDKEALNMKVSGKMESLMEQENSLILILRIMKVNGNMAQQRGLEFINNLMELYRYQLLIKNRSTRVNGKIIYKMELERKFIKVG